MPKIQTQENKIWTCTTQNVGVLVPWETVHTDLIGPYTLTAKKYQPDGTEKEVTLQLTFMIMLDPVTGWFEVAEVPTYIV